MASLDQLKMLDDGESSTSTSNESDNDEDNVSLAASKDDRNDENGGISTTAAATAAPNTGVVGHHKKRIKLTLGGNFKAILSSSEPEQQKQLDNEKPSTSQTKVTSHLGDAGDGTEVPIKKESGNISATRDTENETKAKHVTKEDKNDTTPKMNVATAPARKKTKAKKRTLPLPTNSLTSSSLAKRTSIRGIRIGPMSSPGLLLPPGSRAGTINDDVSLLPSRAFDLTMKSAGYTIEARNATPHRGSSVQRIVDDIFDSNVKFCLHFPKLVPDDLIQTTSPKVPLKAATTTQALPQSSLSTESIPILMKRLTKALQVNPDDKKSGVEASSAIQSSKLPQYSDISPLSLTMTYPDEYIQKRLEYVKAVDEREKAIIDVQEQEVALQSAPDEKKTIPPVPPIPEPPCVPKRDDLQAITKVENIFGSEDQQQRNHPLYLPKNQRLVDHLDKECFHAVHGRFFGLCSNAIADPYFYGPNAPGISGLNLSASTGLATASSGGGVLGTPLFMMPAQPPSSIVSSKTA